MQPDGSTKRIKERIYIGTVAEMTKQQARAKAREEMSVVNNHARVIHAQINFGKFLDEYEQKFILKLDNLSASTQAKYQTQIKTHIRPRFGSMMMAEITTKVIDEWLNEKGGGRSCRPRPALDLRNILSGIFSQAEKWGYHQQKNPVLGVTIGKHRPVREKHKLTEEQTRALLEALPEDVRLICMICLFCTLRISEALGLQWKHVDWDRGVVMVRQRFFRGDLDVPKTRKATRDLPLGQLVERLRAIYPGAGHDDDFVFSVRTVRGICRDDRDINQHFLRKAAIALGIYWKGFGFHAFRREAITSISATAGVGQAMNAAGHTRAEMSQLYTLTDLAEQERAVRLHQDRILGVSAAEQKAPEPLATIAAGSQDRSQEPAPTPQNDGPKMLEFGPEWAKSGTGSLAQIDAELRDLANRILSLGSGGPKRTRISDLFRVKEAL